MTGRTCGRQRGQLLQHPVRMPLASACTVTIAAPAATTSGRKRSGSSTRRCASTGTPVDAAAAMNAGPTVSCGQKTAVHDVDVRAVGAAAKQLKLGAEPGQVRGQDPDRQLAAGQRWPPCSRHPGLARREPRRLGGELGDRRPGQRTESPARSAAPRPAPGRSSSPRSRGVEPAGVAIRARLHRDHVGARAELPPGDVVRQLVTAVPLVDAEAGGPVQHGGAHVAVGVRRPCRARSTPRRTTAQAPRARGTARCWRRSRRCRAGPDSSAPRRASTTGKPILQWYSIMCGQAVGPVFVTVSVDPHGRPAQVGLDPAGQQELLAEDRHLARPRLPPTARSRPRRQAACRSRPAGRAARCTGRAARRSRSGGAGS